MRSTIILAAALLVIPTVAQAQFPAPGEYEGTVGQAGGDGSGDFYLRVADVGDSLAISFSQDNTNFISPSEQGEVGGGWYIDLTAPVVIHCRFVTLSDKWESYCENPDGEPQFVFTFERTPMPPKSGEPASEAP